MPENQEQKNPSIELELTKTQINEYSKYANKTDEQIKNLLSAGENTEIEQYYDNLHSKLENIIASENFNQADFDAITKAINHINKGFELLPTAQTFDINNNPIGGKSVSELGKEKGITDIFNSKEHQDNIEEITAFNNKNSSERIITNLSENSIQSIKENLENKKFTISDIKEAVKKLQKIDDFGLKDEDIKKWFDKTNNGGNILIEVKEIRKENNQIMIEFDNPWDNKEFNKISLFDQIKSDGTLKENWLGLAVQSSINLMKNIEKSSKENMQNAMDILSGEKNNEEDGEGYNY